MPRSAPDAVVVDLEDAVARDDKDTARHTATDAVAALPDGLTVLIRVNPSGSPWLAEDVSAAVASSVAGAVLPKLEHATQLTELRGLLADHGRDDAVVIAGLETALGVADCRELLSAGVAAAPDDPCTIGYTSGTTGHPRLRCRGCASTRSVRWSPR